MRELAEIIKDEALVVELGTGDFLPVMEDRTRELDSAFLDDGGRRGDGSFHGAMVVSEGLALYGALRESKPAVCIETGVANGLSSAFLLKAIEMNGAGKLYSIDLPGFAGEGGYTPDGGALIPAGRRPGWLVPDSLRGNWELLEGPTQDLLPSLLERLGAIDFFLHDSEHSYDCMTFEYEAAIAYLRPGGVLMSHDIYSTDAFPDFIGRHHLKFDTLGALGLVQVPGERKQ